MFIVCSLFACFCFVNKFSFWDRLCLCCSLVHHNGIINIFFSSLLIFMKINTQQRFCKTVWFLSSNKNYNHDWKKVTCFYTNILGNSRGPNAPCDHVRRLQRVCHLLETVAFVVRHANIILSRHTPTHSNVFPIRNVNAGNVHLWAFAA